MPTIALRPMLPADGPALVAIFVSAIEALTAEDYDPRQQAAWMSVAEDEPAFTVRLAGWITLVATSGGDPVGFASLRSPDVVEMLYVSPDAVGQGVATALVDACEKLGKARGAAEITVQASDTAQGFFKKRGYQARQRGTVVLGDEWLGRTEMRKALDPPTPR